METSVHYLVGIDPQTSLLAIDIKDDDRDRRVKWYQVLLRRKDSFQKAEDWQNYVVEQCIRTVNEIESIIQLYHRTTYTGRSSTRPYRVFFAVEQQRGRVKTIPETCLVTAARMKKWTIRIPHPKTWKKTIDFNKPDPNQSVVPLQGNKANKVRAQELYEKELRAYCMKEKLTPPKVIHHLCDAACLVAFLSKVTDGDEKQEIPTTTISSLDVTTKPDDEQAKK
jgi:hypothetical protein